MPRRITLVQGDITDQHVDAIVNAANASLMGGGGVDGAIHRKGGAEILAECREIRRKQYPRGLPTGEAVATTAGHLFATWVIHTVGPVYAKRLDRSRLLAACHTNSLRVAEGLGAASIAFPAISTGVYGYPADLAARTALDAVMTSRTSIADVRFVLYDDSTYAAFDDALREALS